MDIFCVKDQVGALRWVKPVEDVEDLERSQLNIIYNDIGPDTLPKIKGKGVFECCKGREISFSKKLFGRAGLRLKFNIESRVSFAP